MTCSLYRAHWGLILAALSSLPDDKFAAAVSVKVQAALDAQNEAMCVEVEGQSVGFRKLAGMIHGEHREIAQVILMLCDAEMWFRRWDEVGDLAAVSG